MFSHQEKDFVYSNPQKKDGTYFPEELPSDADEKWTTAKHSEVFMRKLDAFEKNNGRLPLGSEATALHKSAAQELTLHFQIISLYHGFTKKLVTLFRPEK